MRGIILFSCSNYVNFVRTCMHACIYTYNKRGMCFICEVKLCENFFVFNKLSCVFVSNLHTFMNAHRSQSIKASVVDTIFYNIVLIHGTNT